jgi:hypothetical protein
VILPTGTQISPSLSTCSWVLKCAKYFFIRAEVRLAHLFIQGYSKRSIHFQKFILQKTTEAKTHVLCTDGKEISQSSDIDDLKRRITEAVAAVICDMLRRVWEELDYRFDIRRVTRGARVLVRCENNFESSPCSLYL